MGAVIIWRTICTLTLMKWQFLTTLEVDKKSTKGRKLSINIFQRLFEKNVCGKAQSHLQACYVLQDGEKAYTIMATIPHGKLWSRIRIILFCIQYIWVNHWFRVLKDGRSLLTISLKLHPLIWYLGPFMWTSVLPVILSCKH